MLQSTEDSLDSAGVVFSSTPLSSPPISITEMQPSLSAPIKPSINEIVIVLNTNAKGVTKDLIDTARHVTEQWDIDQRSKCAGNCNQKVRLLVTSTYDEARSASRNIMAAANTDGSATLVIPVGGDGTLTAMINLLWEEYRSISIGRKVENAHLINGNGDDHNGIIDVNNTESSSKFPIVFGYVAMGTGNALGSVVGCLPVTLNPNYRRKRRKILKFLRQCLRPQNTKREDFRLVLSQVIEAAAQTHRQPKSIEKAVSLQPNPIEVDVVDLPLIRVRTIRGEIEGETTSENLPNGDTTDEMKKDQYAFFAGLGYDSLLLQDYKDMQDWTKTKTGNHSLWQLVTTGVIGYTVAMFTRSLPKLLKLEDASRLLRDVKITTNDPTSAYWIDHRRGDTMRPAFSSSQHAWGKEEDKKHNGDNESVLLYRGSAGIIATGTVPFYGGGLRLFPFARMTPSGMHLRVGREFHPLEGVSRIPSIFEGSYRDKKSNTFQCLDFVGNQFAVEIYESFSLANHQTEKGFPVQHSGETMGRCTRVEFTVSLPPGEMQQPSHNSSTINGEDSYDSMPPPIRFVTLMPPRIVSERRNSIDLHP